MDLLIATQNVGFSPIKLFLDADLVVKSVMTFLQIRISQDLEECSARKVG